MENILQNKTHYYKARQRKIMSGWQTKQFAPNLRIKGADAYIGM
ncbi:hypothetical protein [Mucilaginibacter sp.]|nr:hypothetical protein [Mucilaginibacter sp.]MDR3693819.1 hypothetical protein [Mucilaginibacter sp.]